MILLQKLLYGRWWLKSIDFKVWLLLSTLFSANLCFIFIFYIQWLIFLLIGNTMKNTMLRKGLTIF
ncbi:MAG: hypothetical protein DI610_10005 [Staphylococcus hominis]|nr:MAG: hypothetical protein DI610_10005 [Staphylococcus hominis]